MKVSAISQQDYVKLNTQKKQSQLANLKKVDLSDTFIKQNNQPSFKGIGGGTFGACVGSFLAMSTAMVLGPGAIAVMVGAHLLGSAAGGYLGHKIEEKAGGDIFGD